MQTFIGMGREMAERYRYKKRTEIDGIERTLARLKREEEALDRYIELLENREAGR